jgi:glycosyltransferase involved in cell wall biosynthesis
MRAKNRVEMAFPEPKVVCLSNVYDQSYHDLRGEDIPRCLSWGKRRDLFHCFELATGKKVIVLSSPPKALARKAFKWLPATRGTFAGFDQFFAPNWDGPKLRVPFSWLFYAFHALRRVRHGDIIIIDNYELIYVITAWCLRVFRNVTFILDYEDGKHLIDRSWSRALSGWAEWLGRPLLSGALLAHPAMGKRLPSDMPKELIPGFITSLQHPRPVEKSSGFRLLTRLRPEATAGQASAATGVMDIEDSFQKKNIRFLYSGSLDESRGIPLILDALALLPEEGWQIEVTGTGPLRSRVEAVCADPKWRGKLFFHGSLPTPKFNELVSTCHVGINAQRSDDPVSAVTFPSKVFFYLSSGLTVLSSIASEVEAICGAACLYFREDTARSLAAEMTALIHSLEKKQICTNLAAVEQAYSIQGTAERLKRLLELCG